jgi:hypothetical protein
MVQDKLTPEYMARFEAAATLLGHPKWGTHSIQSNDLVIAVAEKLQHLQRQIDALTQQSSR